MSLALVPLELLGQHEVLYHLGVPTVVLATG